MKYEEELGKRFAYKVGINWVIDSFRHYPDDIIQPFHRACNCVGSVLSIVIRGQKFLEIEISVTEINCWVNPLYEINVRYGNVFSSKSSWVVFSPPNLVQNQTVWISKMALGQGLSKNGNKRNLCPIVPVNGLNGYSLEMNRGNRGRFLPMHYSTLYSRTPL